MLNRVYRVAQNLLNANISQSQKWHYGRTWYIYYLGHHSIQVYKIGRLYIFHFTAGNSKTWNQPITEPVGFHKTCPQWAKLLLNILCYCRCDLSRNYFSEGKIEIALHFSYLAFVQQKLQHSTFISEITAFNFEWSTHLCFVENSLEGQNFHHTISF